jgi:hypothetical protein
MRLPGLRGTDAVRQRTIEKGICADRAVISPPVLPAAQCPRSFVEIGLSGKDLAMSRLQGSEYYRKRADELRHAAGEPCSSENRDTLLWFADDLDRIADQAEDAGRKQIAKPTAC